MAASASSTLDSSQKEIEDELKDCGIRLIIPPPSTEELLNLLDVKFQFLSIYFMFFTYKLLALSVFYFLFFCVIILGWFDVENGKTFVGNDCLSIR